MSAFVVSDKHLSYIASAGVLYCCAGYILHDGDVSGEVIAKALLRENNRSVNYRYKSHEARSENEQPAFRFVNNIDPVVLLKQIACYEYQACEHPEWRNGDVYKFCKALKGEAIQRLSGYSEAPWGL